LRAEDHCVFLPRLDPDMFMSAMGQCDIFLDSIDWAGCNSTMESLAYDLPIVTMPGTLMRGRHSAADCACIAALEDFLERVAREPRDRAS
jgi:predicted O-linked N-acetylglucosamine transferase (SPINDLY family)